MDGETLGTATKDLFGGTNRPIACLFPPDRCRYRLCTGYALVARFARASGRTRTNVANGETSVRKLRRTCSPPSIRLLFSDDLSVFMGERSEADYRRRGGR